MGNLFLSSSIEKVARRGIPLGDNPEDWPSNILKEAFAQIPYLHDYDVSVVLDKQDDKQGYALGYLDVVNKAGAPISIDPKKGPSQMTKRARVPVIVKEGEMRPLNVFVNKNAFEPLTERRLGSALVRADIANITSVMPRDQSLVDQLYPPYRSQYSLASGTKTASASIIDKISSTMSDRIRQSILSEIRSEPTLLFAMDRNDSFAQVINKISNARPLSAEQAKMALMSSLSPDAVQITKGTGFFKVKMANASVFQPSSIKLSRDEVVTHFGEELADKADRDGCITVGRSFVVNDPGVSTKPISQFGRYRVKEASGAWREGWVFPFLVDLDMSVRDIALFTDGLQGAVQEKIAGVEAEGIMFPASTMPKGTGTFVASYGDRAIATIPVTIGNHVRTPDQNYFLADTIDGRNIKLSMVHGISKISSLSDDHYAIPADMGFVPVRGGLRLLNGEDHSDIIKQASSSVYIKSDGQCFSLEGCPLDKVAVQDKEFIPRQDAEFLLVAMGTHPTRADASLSEASIFGSSKVAGMCTITSYEDAIRDVVKNKLMISMDDDIPARCSLLKEASMLEDENTVDAVLSLGFINRDNLALFVDNIPQLEKAAGNLAELYVATQLGMKQLDEEAVFRAMRGIDGVLDGLRGIGQAETDA